MVGTSTVLVLVGAKLAWHGVWVCSGGCRPLVGTAGSPSTHGVALPFLLQWLSAGGRVHASNDLDGLQNGVGVIQATSAAVMEDIEWYVYLLTLDDYSPHALVRSLAGAGDREHWSFAVELTYRCLSSGLWRLSYGLPPELGLSSIDRRSEHQQSDQHHGAWSTCIGSGLCDPTGASGWIRWTLSLNQRLGYGFASNVQLELVGQVWGSNTRDTGGEVGKLRWPWSTFPSRQKCMSYRGSDGKMVEICQ